MGGRSAWQDDEDWAAAQFWAGRGKAGDGGRGDSPRKSIL